MTAAEIRETAKAWVECDDMGDGCDLHLQFLNVGAAYPKFGYPPYAADSRNAMAVSWGEALNVPVLHGDTVLYSPPDRLAALKLAGDGLAEAVDYMMECRMDMSRITHAHDKLNAALAAWKAGA